MWTSNEHDGHMNWASIPPNPGLCLSVSLFFSEELDPLDHCDEVYRSISDTIPRRLCAHRKVFAETEVGFTAVSQASQTITRRVGMGCVTVGLTRLLMGSQTGLRGQHFGLCSWYTSLPGHLHLGRLVVQHPSHTPLPSVGVRLLSEPKGMDVNCKSPPWLRYGH